MDASSAEPTPELEELIELALRFGQPIVRSITLEADKYLFQTRQRRASSRRGEVVMVIEHTAGEVLLHRKGWYERGVYRLHTGGIDAGDSVEATLVRELWEETGLRDGEIRYLGIINCLLQYQSDELEFTSHIFHVLHPQGELKLPNSKEDISDIRGVPIEDLPQVADNLRKVPSPRARWGHWRAIAHDFAYEALISHTYS